MKLGILFYYITFVVLASVIAITVDNGGSLNSVSISRTVEKNKIALPSEVFPIFITSKTEPVVAENVVEKSIIDLQCPDCNIILLSVDSLRADHIGAYGYKRDTTPFFDTLAKKGILFENYFSTSFLTPVSEMSVHTGMYPSAHKTTNFDKVLPEDITTLAQYFQQKGYTTSALLSSPEFVINSALEKSFSRGFDRFIYFEDDEIPRAYPPIEQINTEADAFSGMRFFWWVGVGGVHWPYGGSQMGNIFTDSAYRGIFYDKKLDWSEFRAIYNEAQYPAEQLISGDDIQYVIDQYDNGVSEFDMFLEQFIDELAERKLLDRTIIIIQSEHGEDLHEHGYFAHYDIFDTQTHVPLLILYPRHITERRIKSFASSVDIFPTIAEMVEGVALEQFQGKSLVPIMSNAEKDGARQEIFLERNPLWEETPSIRAGLKNFGIETEDGQHKDIGIRTPRWKYILRTSKQAMEKINWWQAMTGKKIDFPEEELFDLVNDPGETKNVIDQYPNEATELHRKLQTWFKQITSISRSEPITEPVIQPYF